MSRNISRRSTVAALSGFAVTALAAPHVARAAVRTVRLGHLNPDESHHGRGCAAFANAVAASDVLAGTIRIEVHGNAELGDELAMLKSCASGTLDGMLASGGVLGNLAPEAGLLNAPFLFRDVATARSVLDGAIGAEYAEILKQKDVHVLAWAENGLRHITANRPIRTPADLQGLRIRVPQSEVMSGGFKALGADAAPLAFNLLREALRTGQFQAQENPIVTIEAKKLNELQKYLSLTGHIYDPSLFIISPDLMEDLTKPQHAALVACAKIGAAVTREAASSAEGDGVARLRAAGMVVVDDVDVAAFRKASKPYLESLSAKYGEARMQRLIAAGAGAQA